MIKSYIGEMDFMNERIIASFPVYSITENSFNQKWNIFYEKSYNNTMFKDKEKYISTLEYVYFPTNSWKYNKIIGFIEIIVSKEDIIFEIYRSPKKIFPYNSKSKHFVGFFPSLGNHFSALGKNNQDLKDEIQQFLKSIEEHDFLGIKNIYVDYTCFENFIKYFDLRNFIDNEF